MPGGRKWMNCSAWIRERAVSFGVEPDSLTCGNSDAGRITRRPVVSIGEAALSSTVRVENHTTSVKNVARPALPKGPQDHEFAYFFRVRKPGGITVRRAMAASPSQRATMELCMHLLSARRAVEICEGRQALVHLPGGRKQITSASTERPGPSTEGL